MDASDPEPTGRSTRGWLRSHLWLFAIVAAVLLLYTLAGFLLVPYLARQSILQYAQKDLGRRASIAGLTFNPYTFTAELRGFALAEADGRPIVSFDLLRIRASMTASLAHRAWTLDEVRLEQPVVHARINPDGSLNLAQLGPKVPAPKAPGSAPTHLPALRVMALGVHGGSVQFEDLSRKAPFSATLAPIEFDLTDFRTAPSHESRYHFTAATSAGEGLDWSGEISVQPLGSDGQFTLTSVKAATVASYLQGALPFALESGSLDVNGSYHFVATPVTALTLTLPSIKIHTLAIAPAHVAGAAAGSAGPSKPWISLPELEITDTSVALNEHRLLIGQVTVQKADVQVWREPGGSLNLLQLLGPAAATVPGSAAATTVATASPVPPAAAPPGPAWSIALKRLQIQDASVEAQDRSMQPAVALHLGAIALTVQNYANTGNAPLSVELQAAVGDGGHVHAQGTITLAPLRAALDLDIGALDMPVLQPYIGRATDMTLYRGRFGLKGHVSYAEAAPEHAAQLEVAMGLDVSDLATRDNLTNDDFVSWKSLQIEDLHYQLVPASLSIGRIVVRAPYGRVIIGPKGNLNITDVLRGTHTHAPAAASMTAPVPAAPPPAAPPRAHRARTAASKASVLAPTAKTAAAAASVVPGMPIRIGRIEIHGGVADFTDHSVAPTFSTAIYGLGGTVTGLSSDPASRASVTLKGSVDRYAPVSITGQLNVLSAATYTDIAMSFSNIELTTFNPYSGKFAGYSIAQGKLTTQMHYHVENRKLDATHHIVIDQLEFGAATESKQAVPLPIKLAVSLLKDRNGVITLDLPVGGSLDDPTFRVGPIIWKMVVGLLRKIVTAPFALLGSLFGGGPQLSYIDFPVGISTLTAAQTEKLGQLAKALVERPQLKLDIPLHTLNDDDVTALEHTALDAALQAAAAPRPGTKAGGAGKEKRPSKGKASGAAGPPAAPSPHTAALETLYRTRLHAEPVYPPDIAGAADPDAARAAWLEQQLLPQFAPGHEQRDALALARAQAVQSAVLANADLKPERVFLVNQTSGGGPAGSVRMDLKLE